MHKRIQEKSGIDTINSIIFDGYDPDDFIHKLLGFAEENRNLVHPLSNLECTPVKAITIQKSDDKYFLGFLKTVTSEDDSIEDSYYCSISELTRLLGDYDLIGELPTIIDEQGLEILGPLDYLQATQMYRAIMLLNAAAELKHSAAEMILPYELEIDDTPQSTGRRSGRSIPLIEEFTNTLMQGLDIQKQAASALKRTISGKIKLDNISSADKRPVKGILIHKTDEDTFHIGFTNKHMSNTNNLTTADIYKLDKLSEFFNDHSLQAFCSTVKIQGGKQELLGPLTFEEACNVYHSAMIFNFATEIERRAKKLIKPPAP